MIFKNLSYTHTHTQTHIHKDNTNSIKFKWQTSLKLLLLGWKLFRIQRNREIGSHLHFCFAQWWHDIFKIYKENLNHEIHVWILLCVKLSHNITNISYLLKNMIDNKSKCRRDTVFAILITSGCARIIYWLCIRKDKKIQKKVA